jgi:6-phosphogluconolactonase/glucosamine-6-phosphate isomerase/deaminase
MEVGIDHAGHYGRTAAVDDRGVALHRARSNARRATRHLLDAVALDENFPGIGIFAGGIEDADVSEENGPVGVAVPAV